MLKIELNETQNKFTGKKVFGGDIGEVDYEQLVSGCPVTQWNTSCINDGLCLDPRNPKCIIRHIEKADPGVSAVEIK